MKQPEGSYFVNSSSLQLCHESDEAIEQDPRGLFLMWEEPISTAKYVVSFDPTVGVSGWTRATRADGDHKIDNSALQVLRVDALKEPLLDTSGVHLFDPVTKQPRYIYRDLQVGEFAGPCDGTDIARIANVVGRVYRGNADDQAELIYESYPGPGILSTQELLHLGYGNIWLWERIADSVAEQTNRMGWYSTRESQKILWIKSRRHLLERKIKINSKYLKEEYANAEIDPERQRAKASYGWHDDRMQACNMAMWAAHKWDYDPESTNIAVSHVPIVDRQHYAPTLEDGDMSLRDRWNAEVESWLDD